MQLDYRKTRSGLYILKKEDFDDIAFMVLKEYQPIMLTKAQPLDVDDFIYERLFLDMKTARLSVDGRILGVIALMIRPTMGLTAMEGQSRSKCRSERYCLKRA